MRPRKLKTDILAQALIPCDVPKNLIACEVVGDGNCLYNAKSVCLGGAIEYSTVLCLLTAIELFENAQYYSNHPMLLLYYLIMKSPFSHLPSLNENGMSEWERSRDHVSAIQSETIGGCQLGKWSSLMHIMALSTVICRPIFIIYPNCIRPLVHGLVKSCIDLSDTFPDEECFNILWSSDGGLDSDPKAIYIPNHFVPLFDKEQEDRLKQKTTSAKLLIGS